MRQTEQAGSETSPAYKESPKRGVALQFAGAPDPSYQTNILHREVLYLGEKPCVKFPGYGDCSDTR